MLGEAIVLLEEVVTLVNRTWGRFLYPDKMIWENAWTERPSWAHENKSLL